MGKYDFNFGYSDPENQPVAAESIVQDVEPEQPLADTGPCMCAVTCSRCKRRHGICNEINEQLTGIKDDSGIYSNPGISPEEWKNDMIPRGNDGGNQGGGNQRGGKRKGSGYTYLSASDLTNERQTANILDARTQDDNFKPGKQVVVVKIKFQGGIKLWTLRPGNPNLDTLGDAMGDDETQWKNRSVELFTEQDGFDGKTWIRSEVIEQTTTAPKKTKGR